MSTSASEFSHGDLLDAVEPGRIALADGAVLLRAFARDDADALIAGIAGVAAHAPFRHMVTPGGFRMSVAMTNCGNVGWATDRVGYRYSPVDPQTGAPWPVMPASFVDLGRRAALAAGYPDPVADSCLINRYVPGAKLSLHQDLDENDYAAPIVSVSLGLPAIFLFGGLTRAERPRRHRIFHGDVAVWGNASRRAFHGIDKLAGGEHPLTGSHRFNLTFRRAR